MTKKNIIIIELIIITLCFFNYQSYASSKKKLLYQPIKSSLIVDYKSGKILHAYNANKRIYPASLTKLMTLYIIFELLESGKISLEQKFYVSKYAESAKPSKLYLKEGDRITVREIILALIIKSANDAARVAAENIAVSEKRFSHIMTIKARKLGMKYTTFTNASGWHDDKQKTTALDLAKLYIAIKKNFPQYYHLFSQPSFSFKGNNINNTNTLLKNYYGTEAAKTGFTNHAGRNLIASVTRKEKSLIAIITGSENIEARDKKMISLLDKYF